MSQNPFGEKPNPFGDDASPMGAANPYQSPSAASGFNRSNSGDNPLMIPAIALLVLATITLLMILLSAPFQLVQMGQIDMGTPEGMGQVTGMVAALVGWSIFMIAIIIGSIQMLRLKGYSGAVTASVLALLPICSPCYVLGIPFGIWALILLRRPDVKARFS